MKANLQCPQQQDQKNTHLELNRYNSRVALNIKKWVVKMSASVRDVAREAGVSVGTVSNVMNFPEKVASKTVARVQLAIETLNYVRNDAARQLRAGVSRSIGLLVLDFGNPFFTDVARGAEQAASRHQMSLVLANSDEDHEREKQLLGLFEEQRLAGLLVSPVYSNISDLIRVSERGTPIVLVDRPSTSRSLSSVAVDDVAGGALAVRHLIELGKKSIMFAGGPMKLQQIADRLKGSQQAVSAHPHVELEILETKGLSVEEGRNLAHSLMRRPVADRPDAIFAANDLLALGIMHVLFAAANISIPDDIALVGYDDISFASSAIIPLTSIRQPSALLGVKAIDLLMHEANFPEDTKRQQIMFQPELVIRESSKKTPR